MIQRNFKLALTAGRTIPLVIPASQYDSGEQWIFTLIDETGAKYTPATGAIIGLKSDKTAILNAGTVDAAGRVVINETEQMTAAVGKNVYEILINDQTHGSANFIVMVEPRPGDNADFSDSDLSLLQQAIDGTSETAIKAGVQEWMNENLTDPTDPIVDASLSLSGAAADAKKTGDEISGLKSAIAQGGMKDSIKQALIGLADAVGYKNDSIGATARSALYHALYDTEVLSITAVFTQGTAVIYDTDSLDSLKPYLTVTAYYDDGTNGEITSYTLSGTLTVGTSTITVTYGGLTTTFTVTVTASALVYSVFNHVFDGTPSTGIDTNVMLNQTDQDFTILFELDTTESQVSSVTYRIVNSIDVSTTGGVSLVTYDATKTNFRWCNAGVQFSDFNRTTIGNFKFAIRHEAGSGNATIKVKANNGTVNTYTAISQFNASSVALQLGTNGDHTNVLKGTGSCKVFTAYLSDDRIAEFMTNGL